MEQLSEKDTILSELAKTVTRLKNRGFNLQGLFYGINDETRKVRKSKKWKHEPKKKDDEPEDHKTWRPEDDFIKLYPDALSKISMRLTGAEALTIIRLLPFIDYQSGLLKIDKRPLIIKDIMAMTGYSKVTVIGIMDKFHSEQIILKVKCGRTMEFYANPYIFFKGKYINQSLAEKFSNYSK